MHSSHDEMEAHAGECLESCEPGIHSGNRKTLSLKHDGSEDQHHRLPSALHMYAMVNAHTGMHTHTNARIEMGREEFDSMKSKGKCRRRQKTFRRGDS